MNTPYIDSEQYTPRINIYVYTCDETSYTIVVMELTIIFNITTYILTKVIDLSEIN